MRSAHWIRIRALALGVLIVAFNSGPDSATRPAETPQPGGGRTATLLPDGRWLLIGGEGTEASIVLWNPGSGQETTLPVILQVRRAWHTATVLPDGTILVFGGMAPNGALLSAPELVDLQRGRSSLTLFPDLDPRARHTATLLTDGRVLVAGGITAVSPERPSDTADLLDWEAGSARQVASFFRIARRDHAAELDAAGLVHVTGGLDAQGNRASSGEVFDPAIEAFMEERTDGSAGAQLHLAGSMPADGSTHVPPSTRLALRFSSALDVRTLTSQIVSLIDDENIVDVRVVPAEAGRLLFVTPVLPLEPSTTYILRVRGARDPAGLGLPDTAVTFTTAEPDAPEEAPAEPPEEWDPTVEHGEGLDCTSTVRGITTLGYSDLSARIRYNLPAVM